MGILGNLIARHEQEKEGTWKEKADILQSLAGMPNLKPEARDAIFGNLGSIYAERLGVPKKHHGMFGQLIGHMHDHLTKNTHGGPGQEQDSTGQDSQRQPQQGQQGQQGQQRQQPYNLAALMPGPAGESKFTDQFGMKLPTAPAYSPFYTEEQAKAKQQQDTTADNSAVTSLRHKQLKDAGVDPASEAGQEFLLTGKPPSDFGKQAKPLTAKDVDIPIKDGTGHVVSTPVKRLSDGSYTDMTGKPVDPTKIASNTPARPAHTPTSTELALQSYAEKAGKTVDTLTGAEKVAAVREYKSAVKVPSVRASKAVSDPIAKKGGVSPQYQPGGKSIANPNSDPGLEVMAWEFIGSGHLPFTGMGGGRKGEPNKRELAVSRSGEILRDLGISAAELPAMRSQLKANGSALSKITSLGAAMGQFEDTVEPNMRYAQELSKKYERTNSPFINRITGDLRKQTGDKDVDNFKLQMLTIADEYAKIMAGSTSATGVRVNDAHSAEAIINSYIADKNLSGLFQVIRRDIQNRKVAVEGQKATLVNAMRNPTAGFGTSGGVAPTPPPAPAANAPSNGADALVQVQIPGLPPGHIPRSKLAQFKQVHPNAKVF